jgi:hypothetical protein
MEEQGVRGGSPYPLTNKYKQIQTNTNKQKSGNNGKYGM